VAQVPLSANVSDGDLMLAGFLRIRDELGLPEEFPREVLVEAAAAADNAALPTADRTDLPLVTLDPAGARDLDQALHLERRGTGYRVWYAIADVPTYARPGGSIDAEALRRGVTYYCPDRRIPLHPPELSEGTASLLPRAERSAYLWRMDLDSDAELLDADVSRARVRSRGQYDYAAVQGELEAARADDVMELLREIGTLRQEAETARGGVSLSLPRQTVVTEPGGYRLESEAPAQIEGWNAQVSLLTGMCAARMMLDAGVGVLRVMPPPSEGDVGRVRAVARALHLPWSKDTSYPEFIRSLDPLDRRTVPMMMACTALMRGADYAVVAPDMPLTTHSAVAAPYAHVTAPLRRLVDRYGLATSAAICAGAEVPPWVSAGIAEVPAVMKSSAGRARTLERANVDLVEAGVLAGREGECFQAVALERRGGGTMVQVAEPAVTAMCHGEVQLGAAVVVRLDRADVEARTVEFSLIGAA
jgi:exoribonuclease R